MDNQDTRIEVSFRGKNSVSKRIWHWATFIAILGSLITVLLAKTILNTRSNISIVQESLQQNNVAVTPMQARSVSHEFNDLIWHWHIYIGYVLSALFLFRLVYEFFQPKEQKLIPLIKKANRYLKQPSIDIKYGRHYLFVKYMYVIFYIALATQVCTGLFMVYSDNNDKLKDIRHTASDVHSFSMWVIISYIVLHIGGVIITELSKKDKGIVSDMINGGEDQ